MRHVSLLRMLRILWAFSLLLLAAQSQEPSSQPRLRIEPGSHTERVNQLVMDPQYRFFVTGSSDKTVRIWDPAGNLMRVLRPPSENGREGEIRTVAISPDGRTIASAGITGTLWDKTASIYLFDRQTGALVRRIAVSAEAVQYVVWSPDGRYLAALLPGKNGIRLYQAPEYNLVAEDRDYGGNAVSADFAQRKDGTLTLVTASVDDYLRVYEVGASLQLVTRRKPVENLRPLSVQFSPDRTLLAVGCTPWMTYLFRATDLSIAAKSQLPVRGVTSVAWSPDGLTLFASGPPEPELVRSPDQHSVVRWKIREGKRSSIPMGRHEILSMAALPKGQLAVAMDDGGLAIVDANGDVSPLRPPKGDFGDLSRSLAVSRDGGTVQFQFQPDDTSATTFSITEPERASGPILSGNDLRFPVSTTEELTIDKRRDYSLRINDRAIVELEDREPYLAVAIAPDRRGFALVGLSSVRFYDRNGNQKWRTAAPAVPRGVNVSGNGRLVVAAFADGTIRWFRMQDGKELLALFAHSDRKRWILWTPSGYYDASPGAEDLIGWHVNNGKESAAAFYPVSRFRASSYRPKLVAGALNAMDEPQAVQLAGAAESRPPAPVLKMAPPLVSVISPSDGEGISTTEVILRYATQTPSGEPITKIQALVDGRPVAVQRDLRIESNLTGQTIRIKVPERDSAVSIIAENRFAASEPATVRLKWRGAAPKDEFIIKPKLYVLAVGISKYRNPNFLLQVAAKDARDFASAMSTQKGALYRDVEAKLILDDQATKEKVLDGLDWIRKSATQHDVAMVLLSGHGVNDENGDYYFVPVDIDPQRINRSAVPFADIRNTVQALPGKVVFFVDTCHSGNVMGSTTRGGPADINAIVNELASAENGAVVFAASTGRQVALERPEWGNGAFTKAVIEGLTGRADLQRTGRITVNMLDLYVSERVKELTGGRQTPTTTKPYTVPDFPIAIGLRN